MGTALERQLSALGWRAVGFGLGLLLLASIAALWGHRIEGRIERVDVQRHHDHRLIIRLAEGKPLHTHPSAHRVSPSTIQGSGGEAATEAPSHVKHHTGNQAVRGHEPKATHTHHSKSPKRTPAESAPAEAAAPESSASSTPQPEEPGSSGETPAAQNSNGVKACVDAEVSACVKAELPSSH